MAGFSSGGVGVAPSKPLAFWWEESSKVMYCWAIMPTRPIVPSVGAHEGGGGAQQSDDAKVYLRGDHQPSAHLRLRRPTPAPRPTPCTTHARRGLGLGESGQEGCARARVPWPVA